MKIPRFQNGPRNPTQLSCLHVTIYPCTSNAKNPGAIIYATPLSLIAMMMQTHREKSEHNIGKKSISTPTPVPHTPLFLLYSPRRVRDAEMHAHSPLRAQHTHTIREFLPSCTRRTRHSKYSPPFPPWTTISDLLLDPPAPASCSRAYPPASCSRAYPPARKIT